MAQLTDFEKASRILADSGFQSRVKGSIVRAALDVKGEAYDTTTEETPTGSRTVPTERSRKRSILADRVLSSSNSVLEQFTTVLSVMPGIVTKYATTITADTDDPDFEKILQEQVANATREIQDNDIDWTVATVWDDLAGVNGWDAGKV
jgi:hypothetical protein